MAQNKILGHFIFLSFVPKILFWPNLVPNSTVLCVKYNSIQRVFKAADFEFKNNFFDFRLCNTFFWANLVSKLQSALKGVFRCADFEFDNCFRQLTTVENLTIVFVNSVPKMFLWGKFGRKTSKCFVLNEARYKVAFMGADFEFGNCFCKLPP